MLKSKLELTLSNKTQNACSAEPIRSRNAQANSLIRLKNSEFLNADNKLMLAPATYEAFDPVFKWSASNLKNARLHPGTSRWSKSMKVLAISTTISSLL
ncbi:hypothetical protein CLU95_3751 [Variovorax sp. 54]|nr:hypothetical protein CLU95_3751 [Variovorax sp. 54]